MPSATSELISAYSSDPDPARPLMIRNEVAAKLSAHERERAGSMYGYPISTPPSLAPDHGITLDFRLLEDGAPTTAAATRARSQVSPVNYRRPYQRNVSRLPETTTRPTQSRNNECLASSPGYHPEATLTRSSPHELQSRSHTLPDGRREESRQRDMSVCSPLGLDPGAAIMYNPNGWDADDARPFDSTVENHDAYAWEYQLDPQAIARQSQPVRRTSSTALSQAIAKHRAQRKAAGLPTEGEYFVDPKTKKHYFVAASGAVGGVASKVLSKSKSGTRTENEAERPSSAEKTKKKRERKKLHKKEPGWEAASVRLPPPLPSPQHPAESMSSRGMATCGKMSQVGPSTTARHASSTQRGSIDASPFRPLRTDGVMPDRTGQQEILKRGGASPTTSPFEATYDAFQTPPSFTRIEHAGTASKTDCRSTGMTPGWVPDASSSELEGSPSVAPDRRPSPYSTYSYYEMHSEGRQTPFPNASPATSQGYFAGHATPEQPQPPSAMPLHSPYIAPTESRFQPHPPGSAAQETDSLAYERKATHGDAHSTLLKAKSSIHRHSLQLLAPSKHSNLTVPKVGKGVPNSDMATLDRNDPLVCLHLGIDAHEQGDLQRSAALFEQSARGGCGLGMLMYGLALRHGWVSPDA